VRIRSFGFWGIVLSAFIVGVVLGFLKGRDIYSFAYRFGLITNSKTEPREQLLNEVFNEPVYEGELRYDAIQDLTEIRSYPERNLLNTNQFDSAFERINILSVEHFSIALRTTTCRY
jgi:hypothetical protein